MRYTTSDPKFQDPVWMSPEERKEPEEFISDFCQSWDLSDCRFYLWQMLSNSVASDSQPIGASARSQVYFFESIVAMIEAVYLVNRISVTTTDGSLGEEEEVFGEFAGVDSDGLPVYRDEGNGRSSLSALAGWDSIESELSLFFDSYKPVDFAVRWRAILEAYSAQDYYKQGSPSDVVYAIEKLTDLIKVAYEIYPQLPGEGFPDEAPEVIPAIGNAHLAIRQFFEARGLEE